MNPPGQPTRPILVDLARLKAEVHSDASVGSDVAHNRILCLRVDLLPGTDVGSIQPSADSPRRARRILQEPVRFVVRIDPEGLADLCRRAQMNRSRKAKDGPLVACSVVQNPRIQAAFQVAMRTVCPSCHAEQKPGELHHADGRCFPACLSTVRP